jgi:hypothetical protein
MNTGVVKELWETPSDEQVTNRRKSEETEEHS